MTQLYPNPKSYPNPVHPFSLSLFSLTRTANLPYPPPPSPAKTTTEHRLRLRLRNLQHPPSPLAPATLLLLFTTRDLLPLLSPDQTIAIVLSLLLLAPPSSPCHLLAPPSSPWVSDFGMRIQETGFQSSFFGVGRKRLEVGFEKEENEIETDGRGSDLSCLQWTAM
ncbi:hypothetical protein L1887_30234 [Cichorium endivia]|nr:hypothetical protein L1887_30234 [Cichorium endivia]